MYRFLCEKKYSNSAWIYVLKVFMEQFILEVRSLNFNCFHWEIEISPFLYIM